MESSIVLDQPVNTIYTNLDIISGRVVVRTAKSADVESILVKLEGESLTRLQPGPGPNGEKSKPRMEYHKILYKVQMAFPPSEVIEGRSSTAGPSKPNFTLPPGQHEYPFRFKLPFNNSCHSGPLNLPTMVGLELTRPAAGHVKTTLPPTLRGYPGEAEIKYYVKATVNRKSIFKENPRAYAPFTLLPIEPPRPSLTGSEIFARQKHEFTTFRPSEAAKAKMKGLFSKKASSTTSTGVPYISVDARLPQPAILTCNQDVPMRIIIKKLKASDDVIYLQSLQIALVGHTKVRAHDVFRTETDSWIITSKSNLNIVVGKGSDPIDHETLIDDRLWRGQALPNTVAPSFRTCNIDRSYQLDVRVGLSYPGGSHGVASKPETVVLPMRLEVEIFSGIAPPTEVLSRMAASKSSQPAAKSQKPASSTTQAEGAASKLKTEILGNAGFGANQVPLTPVEESGTLSMLPQDHPAAQGFAQAPAEYNDAPPSYEDAIASDLAPVNAPRPHYAPPPAAEDNVLQSDEKKGWVN